MNLHLLNSRPAYVLVSVGFQMGFDILSYCGFIKTVPVELEEAAAIDGCSRMGILENCFSIIKAGYHDGCRIIGAGNLE